MDSQSEVDSYSDLQTCNMDIHTQKLNMKKIEDEIAQLEKSLEDENSVVNFCITELDCIESELTGCIAQGETSSIKLLEVNSEVSRIETELTKEKRKLEKKSSEMADKKARFLQCKQEGEEKYKSLVKAVSKGDSYHKMQTLENALAEEQACAATAASISSEILRQKNMLKDNLVNMSEHSSKLIITASQLFLQLRKMKKEQFKSHENLKLSTFSRGFTNLNPKTFQRSLYHKEQGGSSFLGRFRQQQPSISGTLSPIPAKTMQLKLPFQQRTQFNIPSMVLSPNISTVPNKGTKNGKDKPDPVVTNNICEGSQQGRTLAVAQPVLNKPLQQSFRPRLSLQTSLPTRIELPKTPIKTGTLGGPLKSMFGQKSLTSNLSAPEKDASAITRKKSPVAANRQTGNLFSKMPVDVVGTTTESDDMFSISAGNANNFAGVGGQSFLQEGSGSGDGGFDFDNMFGGGTDGFLF